MTSLQRRTNLCKRLSDGDERNRATLGLGDPALDLGPPGLLNPGVLLETRKQPLRERGAFARRELQRLLLQFFQPGLHPRVLQQRVKSCRVQL